MKHTGKIARLGRCCQHIALGALAIELTRDDLDEIESAASKIKVEGARYPEKLEQMTGR